MQKLPLFFKLFMNENMLYQMRRLCKRRVRGCGIIKNDELRMEQGFMTCGNAHHIRFEGSVCKIDVVYTTFHCKLYPMVK
jgi:hypothetical protein